MTSNDKKCLVALNDLTDPEGYCRGFDPVALATALDRRTVRLSVRRLARKGLAEYHKGLFTEDGDVAGSGYCITVKGQDKLKELNDETPAR